MTLPVDDLTPTEVIEQGLVDLSLLELHRATQEGRFYAITPCGKTMGTVYPAWQFEASVPAMLPEVLAVLQEQGESHIHARLVSEEHDLMALAPAEVLAGCVFCARQGLHLSQAALLRRPVQERLALVKEVVGILPRHLAIG